MDTRLYLRLVDLNNDLHIITRILFDINDGCRRFIDGDDLCQDLLDINFATVDELDRFLKLTGACTCTADIHFLFRDQIGRERSFCFRPSGKG